jgi:hypothetical protein
MKAIAECLRSNFLALGNESLDCPGTASLTKAAATAVDGFYITPGVAGGEEALEFHYVCGLKTFGAFSNRELDSGSFIERFEARALY